MNLQFTQEELDFQKEVRDWITENYPEDMKDRLMNSPNGHVTKEEHVKWQQALYSKGWAGVNWPKEYGGASFTASQKYLFSKEMAAARAPGFTAFGISMVAPVIMAFGTDEQKAKYLPDILSSKVWWCQGYSEPGSGSDLASLKTKAELINEDGKDYYIINGSKTWTTLAQNADWIFCLVRTDSSGKKQEGISFLLIDMKSPGIEVKPIITIDGDHEVNSVFFTDVKVPAENLIGEEGKGWTYAKFLLAHERFGIAGVGASKRQLERLKEISKDLGDDDLIAKVSQLEIDIMALEFTELRLLSALEGGGNPGAESSILKIKGTEIQQRLTELYVEAAGEFAIPYGGPDGYGSNVKPNGPEYTNDALSKYLNMRKVTIYGGSNEIQKNIISKFVLGV